MNINTSTPSWKMLFLIAMLTSMIGGVIGALGFQALKGNGSDTKHALNALPETTPAPRKTSAGKPRPRHNVTTQAIVEEIVKIEEAFLSLHSSQKEIRQWTLQASKALKKQQADSSALQTQFWGVLIGMAVLFLLGGSSVFFVIRNVALQGSQEHNSPAPSVPNSPPAENALHQKALKEQIRRLESNMAFLNETLSQAQTQSQRAVQTATNTAKALTGTIKEIQESLDDLHKESDAGDLHLLGIIKRLQRSLKTLAARTQEGYLHIEDIEFEVVGDEEQ